ncbi:MAG TPA: hypothetical protein VH137_02695 [Gemmatimonadales bacterium]|nr:hypothetical protein [Gemmatimonadales bacterium]
MSPRATGWKRTTVRRRRAGFKRAFAGALLGLFHVCVSGIAQADDVGEAKDLFAQGRQLRARGHCADALPMFKKAYEIYPVGLGSLRNLAECEEALGHFASARGAWLDLGRALQAHAEPRYAGWDKDAEQGAARMAPKVATLTVEVTGPARPGAAPAGPEGFDVTLNGAPLPPSALGTPLDRDPGKYLLRVTGALLAEPREQWVELSAGEARRVVVDLSTPPGPAPHARSKDKTERTAAWVAIGVGAAGLAAAGISALVRQSAIDDVKNNDRCINQGAGFTCPPSEQGTVDRGRVATTLTDVFLVVGAAGLAGGLVLLAVSPTHSATTELVLSPSGVSAIGRF